MDEKSIFFEYEVIRDQIEKYQSKLKDLTITEAIANIIPYIDSSEQAQYNYTKILNQLIEKKLIPLHETGEPIRLKEFKSKHHVEIIENIRSVKEWSDCKIEYHISIYKLFSEYLSKYTLEMIPVPLDLTLLLARRKTIPYDLFLEFCFHLSSRDSLMAHLLYLGAPSIDSVIKLKISDIDFLNGFILFNNNEYDFPKNLLLKIKDHIESEEKKEGLVFTNHRNTYVCRNHLLNSFRRVSKKMNLKNVITPTHLLKIRPL